MGNHVPIFPTPTGATWGDLAITLLTPTTGEARVKGVIGRFDFTSAGLASKRWAHRPNEEWKMLITYAENNDTGAYDRLPRRQGLKMAICRFRRWLRSFFGLPGDPLHPFQGSRWRPKFKIGIAYNPHDFAPLDKVRAKIDEQRPSIVNWNTIKRHDQSPIASRGRSKNEY